MTDDSPVHTQASSDGHDDVLEVSDGPSDGSQGQPAHSNTPSDVATDSARAPEPVQSAASQHGGGAAHAQGHHDSSAVDSHASAPAPGTTPADSTPSSPAPSQPPASQPPASSTPSDPSDGSSQDGSVVGGVVDGVGGAVGGVVDGVVGGLLG